MWSPEQLAVGVEGLTVQDAVLGIQTVDRLAARGVAGPELAPLAWYRDRLVAAVRKSIGVEYDNTAAPAPAAPETN